MFEHLLIGLFGTDLGVTTTLLEASSPTLPQVAAREELKHNYQQVVLGVYQT